MISTEGAENPAVFPYSDLFWSTSLTEKPRTVPRFGVFSLKFLPHGAGELK
jgi:hypothetical protein